MSGLLNLKKGRAVFYMRSKEFNIDNGSGTTDDDYLLAVKQAFVIRSVRAVYSEATDTAGADSANFKVGTAAGGAQVVAATSLAVSKAVGTYTDATIVDGNVAANGMIAIRHTGIATTEAGKYYVQLECEVVEFG